MLDALEPRAFMAADLNFNDFAHVAGTDSAGDVYVYGRIAKTADLDPGPGTSWLVGPADYLAKFTPQKALLWATPASQLFDADSLILDAVGSSTNGQDFVYIAEGSPSGSRSIARFQDTGAGLNELWRIQTGSSGLIAIDGDGAVYMSNSFGGTIDFKPTDPPDPTPLTGDTLTSAGQDAFLAKWDLNGAFQWVRQLGGAGDEWSGDVAVVNSGTKETVYVVGIFNGTFAPQGYTGPKLTDQGGVSNSSDQDGYIVAYDTQGGFVSVGHFVDAAVARVSGDSSGTYIAGSHYYAALGLPGNQNNDIFFAKVDASGQGLAWVKGLAGPASNTVGDLLVDAGSLVLTGTYSDPSGKKIKPMDFNPGAGTYTLTASGEADVYVASYSTTAGAFQWARLMGSSAIYRVYPAEQGDSLAVSGTDLYVGGIFAPGQATFGFDSFVNTADYDGFVTRIGLTDGTERAAFSIGSVVQTIDNRDGGYSEAGSGWTNNTSGGFSSDSRVHAKGTGSNTASWTFTGLAAGTYDVLTTWVPSTKNASNATYKILGTAVTKNQQAAPSDYLSDLYSTYWASLGTFVVGADGKLTVSLSDLANGNVVADAVRIVLETPASMPPSGFTAMNAPRGFPAATALVQSPASGVRAAMARWQPPIDPALPGKADLSIGALPADQV